MLGLILIAIVAFVVGVGAYFLLHKFARNDA